MNRLSPLNAFLIKRGPGHPGVSNAFYLYLLDPDGHRIEIYTHDYYTGGPDNPMIMPLRT